MERKNYPQQMGKTNMILNIMDLEILTQRTSLKNSALPIVDINVVLNASSENLNKTHVLPTPESPIKSNLNK